jgi:hypothetical protein
MGLPALIGRATVEMRFTLPVAGMTAATLSSLRLERDRTQRPLIEWRGAL